MKILALLLVLLLAGDVVFDHGAGVAKLDDAARAFEHSVAHSYRDSVFSG